MTKEQKDTLITDLALDFAPAVKEIENGIATTRNNYGRYGSLLNQLSKGNRNTACFLSLAMIKAGANSQGVADGLKIFC